MKCFDDQQFESSSWEFFAARNRVLYSNPVTYLRLMSAGLEFVELFSFKERFPVNGFWF